MIASSPVAKLAASLFRPQLILRRGQRALLAPSLIKLSCAACRIQRNARTILPAGIWFCRDCVDRGRLVGPTEELGGEG